MSYADDIPVELAQAAHAGTSHVPEQRAQQERDLYASRLECDLKHLQEFANTEEKVLQLVEEFQRYRAGYKERFLKYLAARSRCLSSMITGPSNFPTARNAKRNSAADNASAELSDFRIRALAAIRRSLTPELQPIASGASDAVERLRAQIAKEEAEQEKYKAINAVIRKHAGDPAAQKGALELLGYGGFAAQKLLEPDFVGRRGIPDYMLKNNGANIRRLRKRLEKVEAAKATPDAEVQGNEGIRFEVSAADNRVRVYFPGKPSEDVRSTLKSRGFRWAPSGGCWQAYHNPRSLEYAKLLLTSAATSSKV